MARSLVFLGTVVAHYSSEEKPGGGETYPGGWREGDKWTFWERGIKSIRGD